MLLRRFRAVVLCVFLASLASRSADAAAATASITLQWTAPGDDGMIGRATLYDLRRSLQPITAANFLQATALSGEPTPQPAGSLETFTATGLVAGAGYYFALKSRDEAGNWSPLSNVFYRTAQTVDVGDGPLTLEFSAPWPNPARHTTRCAIALPEGAMIQVDAFDAAGRHVRAIASGWRPAGRSELGWDLRDDAGHPVRSGLYFMRARLGDMAWTRRLVVAR